MNMTSGNNIRERIVKVVFVLLMFSLLEFDVLGQCSIGWPLNLAVYEGTQNIAMMCNSPTKVSWSFKPTSTEQANYKITNYDDVVASNFTNLFAVDSSQLLIKTAQGLATVPPQSTAGVYIMSLNRSATMFGAKLTVVRNDPTCECTRISSTNVNITCSISYADSSYNPISARMNWTANGNFFRYDTPVRRSSASVWTSTSSYWTSTSTIIVDAYDLYTYECTVTFTKPTSATYAYVATNAPVFSASCISPCMGSVPTPTATLTYSQSISPIGTGTGGLTGVIVTIPTHRVNYSQSTTHPFGSDMADRAGLSEGGKIGIGVGIGAGVTLLLVGILFAILCRRYKWTKRTKTEAPVADAKRTDGLEGDYERTQRDKPNTPPYQHLNVLSTPTTDVEATYELFESVA